MTYKPFSVVVVPFPFTDSPQTKRRPALVLSSELYQRKNEHITLAMITSAKHTKWHGDIEIRDLDSAGLSSASIVRQKIFTIDARLIERQAGMLGSADQKSVKSALSEHLLTTAKK